jgi:hypothetical protein
MLDPAFAGMNGEGLFASVRPRASGECHKPKASDDFVFSLPQLLKVAR